MSLVKIDYSELEGTKKRAKEASKEINDYIGEIGKRITKPANVLPGNDDSGYVAAASEQVSVKIRALTEKATRFSEYQKSIETFVSEAKDTDSKVSRNIGIIADAKIEKRNFIQNIGNAIYDFFCVDLGNKTGLTRAISNAVRWCGQKVDSFTEKAIDYFKYGNGQYIWNVVKAVGAALAAAAGAAAAIGTMIVTCGASSPAAIPVILSCIGALAATTSAVITLVNSKQAIESNGKAYELSAIQHNPAAARYYGNIESVSDYYEKTDFGDKATNEAYERKGKTIDTVKVVADVTSAVVNVAQLGNVYDYRYTNKDYHIKGYDFSYENVAKNFTYKAGYRYQIVDGKQVYQLSAKEGLGLAKFKENFFKDGKTVKNITTTVEAVDAIHSHLTSSDPTWESTGEAVDGVLKLASFSDYYGTPKKYTYDVYKKVSGMYETLTEVPEVPCTVENVHYSVGGGGGGSFGGGGSGGGRF